MTLGRIRSLSRGDHWSVLGVTALVVSLLLGLLTAASPGWALRLLALLLAVFLAFRIPGWILMAGLTMTLAGGEFAFIASAGVIVLFVGGAVSGIRLIGASGGTWLPAVLLSLVALLWLGIRFLVVGDTYQFTVVLRSLAAVLLVISFSLESKKPLFIWGLGGVLFVIASCTLGGDLATNTRFDGFSGNPNRMVFGLLIFLPFVLYLVKIAKGRLAKLLYLLVVVFGVAAAFASGSSQAFVALLALAVCCLIWLVSRLGGSSFVIIMTIGLGVLIVAASVIAQNLSISSDLATLSGRTVLYDAAVAVIQEYPIHGSGLVWVSDGAIVDRSAHSALLGLTATGGIPLGIVWIVLMIRIGHAGIRLILDGNITGAAPLIFIALQFVQSVEYTPLAWAIVVWFCLEGRNMPTKTELKGGQIGENNIDRGKFYSSRGRR